MNKRKEKEMGHGRHKERIKPMRTIKEGDGSKHSGTDS